MKPDARNLERLEKWMLHVVSHPSGVEAGLASEEASKIWPVDSVEEIATAGPHLSATDRLRVYADMYYWRLVESLAEDFPVVQFALGEDRFFEIARSYLHACPSTAPNLAHLGARFPQFLLDTKEDLEHRAFLSDVAEVERATNVCFDEKDVASIPAEEILSIDPDAWGDLRLQLIPAQRRLALNYPVDDFIQARVEDRHGEIPGAAPSWILLYRRDYSVWRTVLTEAQFTLLHVLDEGGTLLEAIEGAANVPGTDFEDLVASVGPWFQVWTGVGLFSSFDREPLSDGDERE